MTGSRPVLIALLTTALLQVAIWSASAQGWLTPDRATALHLLTSWTAIFLVGLVAVRSLTQLRDELQARRHQHEATLSEVEQLGALNEMLTTAGKSKDVGLAFQALARRVGKLITCDRLGLALVKEGGQELQIYSSRVSEPERRRRPRPELQFSLERSVFGQVIRTCEPILVEDTSAFASEFHDAGVLASQGFHSLLIVPLISRNRAIGAITVIARQKAAFHPAHREILQPLAEVLAFAYVAQHQYLALDRYKAMETTAEITLALATDINSSLQVIGGRCGVLQREHPALAAELDVIATQAERISTLLERLHAAADEHLRENVTTHGTIPASPEEFSDEEALR
jgi:transcriptional regulator with GAF, ATPase, and Fis domain